MDHSKKSTYLFSIDALRVIAILAVVLIHISTKTLSTLRFDLTLDSFSLFINQASRFAVPLFFLISGFVLELNNKSNLSYTTFFKKRASRIIIPFIFWSVIYFLFTHNYDPSKILSAEFLLTLIQGTAAYHLYFIPTLILFYLAFPILHSQIWILKNPIVLTGIAIIQLVLLYHDYYVKQFELQYDVRVAMLSFFMFILGMVASHYKDGVYSFVKKYFVIFTAFFFLLLAVIYFHVKTLTLKNHTSSYIYNQYGPLNYVYTIVLTSLLYFTLEKTQFLRKQFIVLSKLSFFVFFIHVLIQYIIWDNVVSKIIAIYGKGVIASIWFDPLLFLVIASISFGIAYLIHKFSWAPKLTG